MSRHSDQNLLAGSRLLHVIFADPWRKLVSILLAFALWHYLDNQISDEHPSELTLLRTDTADAPGSNENLLVVIDKSRYFVNRYYDPTTGNPVKHVNLKLRGNRLLINSLNENHGFKFVPSLEKLTNPREEIEFTIEDVRAIDQRFQPIVDGGTMSPATVRIELIENTKESFPLHIGLCSFDSSEELRSRLFRKRATFSEKSVELLGPADQIEVPKNDGRVFVVRLDRASDDDTVARGTLEIVSSPSTDKLRFARPTDITVEVPLRVPWVRFRVDVPYLLDTSGLPEDQRASFRLAEASHSIEIEASADLETTLSTLNDADLADFARRNFRLVVQLLEGDTSGMEDEVSLTPVFWIPTHFYEPEVDYRANDLPPVRVRRVPPQ